MKAIKLLLLFCLTFSFTQCKTMKLSKKAPFTVTGATYHNWVGGQPGVSGTDLIIGVANSTETTFKDVYFQNKTIALRSKNRDGKKYVVANFNTSKRNDNDVLVEGKKETVKATVVKFPFDLKENEAVISYLVGTKMHYFKVVNIKKTKTIYYP